MDINLLLSPNDTPTRETPPPSRANTSSPHVSPLKRPGRPQATKRSSSNLSHTVHSSIGSPRTPQEQQLLTPTLSHNGAFQLPYAPVPSPGFTSAPNGRPVQSAASTHSGDGRASQPLLQRQGSTPSMDTLAGRW
jgi:squamous cell carcinoma antigen recognized by T-cells 3